MYDARSSCRCILAHTNLRQTPNMQTRPNLSLQDRTSLLATPPSARAALVLVVNIDVDRVVIPTRELFRLFLLERILRNHYVQVS